VGDAIHSPGLRSCWRNTDLGELTVGSAGNTTFAVSYTELRDPSDEPVGSMLVLYDVTEQRQREQHVAVLNRVLRHNLRNETTIIRGFAESLEAAVGDPQQAKQAGTIVAASDRLNAIAEKVRSFEDVQHRPLQPESLAPDDVVAEVVQTVAAKHTEATITQTAPSPDLRLHTDPAVLSMALENLVENAIVHADDTGPEVAISVSEPADDSAAVRFEIRDTNEPIPESEIETLRAGEETALKHGKGIGLWISHWCVRKLGGDIDFAYEDGNVVTVTL
jgi:signal transduction histidine kinase